ncbi:MAG: HD domain-containing protein [Spirochaeta sp.]|jgi:putative hydrolase of HD superfamily|nr:HD domain-containing protein [Spirochaeta sp.]
MEKVPASALNTVLDRALQFIELKDLRRTGWVLRGIEDPESVADHSWGTALLCLLYAPLAAETLNCDRAVAIALVHDLAEVEVGDIPRRITPGGDAPSTEEKADRERRAMERLTAPTPVPATGVATAEIPSLPYIYELWDEYEAGNTTEARFVRDMNLVDMCLQALLYERDRRYDPHREAGEFPDYEHLDEFFATAEPRFTTETGKRVYHLVQSRYHELRFV